MSLKFVKQSVSTYVNGGRVRLTKDDPWRSDDPIVMAAPEFFADEPSKVHTSVVKVSTVAPSAEPEADAQDADAEPADEAEVDAPAKSRRSAKKAAAK